MKRRKISAILGSLVLGAALLGAVPAFAHDSRRDHWDGRTFRDYRGDGTRVDRRFFPNGLERKRTFHYPPGYDNPRHSWYWRTDPPRRHWRYDSYPYRFDRDWRYSRNWDRNHDRWHRKHDRWRDNWRYRNWYDYDRPWWR